MFRPLVKQSKAMTQLLFAVVDSRFTDCVFGSNFSDDRQRLAY